MLQTVGVIAEDDDDEGHVLNAMINMEQLAFIKRLDCVERVITNEGLNTLITDELSISKTDDNSIDMAFADADNLRSIKSDAEETHENYTMAFNSVAEVTDNIASSTGKCACASMESAKEITVDSIEYGKICCPGAEQWFKFTVPESNTIIIIMNNSSSIAPVI